MKPLRTGEHKEGGWGGVAGGGQDVEQLVCTETFPEESLITFLVSYFQLPENLYCR